MELQKVSYKRKGDVFLVEVSEEESYGFTDTSWDQFLNRYGTNPGQEGKRISGTDSVNKEVFYRFVEECKAIKRRNVKAADLMQALSNAMSDNAVAPYRDEYISNVAKRVHAAEEALRELKQFLKSEGY